MMETPEDQIASLSSNDARKNSEGISNVCKLEAERVVVSNVYKLDTLFCYAYVYKKDDEVRVDLNSSSNT